MQIELLYFSGCPSAEPAHTRLKELLESRGCKDHIELMCITDENAAAHKRFLGSPTIRINGDDIEPGASDRTGYGLTCRLYRSTEGLRTVPDDALMNRAIDRAIDPASQSATRTPLRYRRMVFMGVMAILLGGLLGLLVAWGQVITFVGATLVMAAYANNGHEHDRQPYMWWAGSAGIIWSAASVTYWWLWRSRVELLASSEPLAAVYDFQQALFFIGLAAFVLMLAATVSGAVTRFRSNKINRRTGTGQPRTH